MASFSRKTGIIGALVIAGVLIGGSVLLSSGIDLSFLNPAQVNAESTQALLQEYATRDSDHDGLPDWEAELYGLDPNNPHSFSPDMTNAQAVARGLVKPKFLTETASSTDASDVADSVDGITAAPNSFTDQFSQTLLTQYLSQSATDVANGTQPSDTDIATLAQGAMQTFAQQNEHQDEYALGQVKLAGTTGPDALKAYAAAAEGVFGENNSNNSNENELDYFSDALRGSDSSAIAHMVAIGKSYSDLAPALMQVEVPTEAQYAHLEIANAAARLGADITDMSTMNTDPLRAYLGLAQYQIDVISLAHSFADMGQVFSDEEVSLSPGDSGYYFYQAVSTAQKKQASASNSSSSQN